LNKVNKNNLMPSLQLPRVKICCIASIKEARLAIKYGASAVGLVSKMPSGPGPIPEELIEEIAATVPPGVSSFLLTSKQDVDSIIGQQRKTKVNTIQLVDKLLYGTHIDLKKALPGISIVQVIHVTGDESVKEALDVSKYVNAILLDSGNPFLKIKELGGTGRVHNWDISKKIVKSVNIPVFLAGGLKPENVKEAVTNVNPFGVDVCSGVRTNGNLDEKKLKAFFENLRR
jgi:phosphoribosylanthranilate isomerase